MQMIFKRIIPVIINSYYTCIYKNEVELSQILYIIVYVEICSLINCLIRVNFYIDNYI